jgi:tRNA (cmo5U34)-methyltransferase
VCGHETRIEERNAMPEEAPHREHDWLSGRYVEEWITGDAKRSEERRPKLRRAASLLPFDRDGAIRFLDLGGGSGEFAAQVLEEFPNSTAVLHDFSPPMIKAARRRLEGFGERVDYRLSDLGELGWSTVFDGPFDAVVSAIAIHNLWDPVRIRAVYDEAYTVVARGGAFFNLDYIFPRSRLLSGLYARTAGSNRWNGARAAEPAELEQPTLENQLRWLREAGFVEVDCLSKELSEVLLCGLRAES